MLLCCSCVCFTYSTRENDDGEHEIMQKYQESMKRGVTEI